MTEQEWLNCTDPKLMLEFLRGKTSDRKLRLFACACARRLWHLLAREEWRPPPDDRSRKAVELAETFVGGRASEADLRVASGPAQVARNEVGFSYPGCGEAFPVMMGASYAEASVADAVAEAVADALGDSEILLRNTGPEAAALRCLFNPFRPVTVNHAWLTWNGGTVRSLAQTIYEECAFDRLPILADALEEAGGDNDDILAHLRSEGPHQCGCWPVDLILGKS